ncbi:hypothetical protein HK099_007672 [Clydaea vesicula]|uniref:Kinase-like protein n=1 Tax=Clydaea vesicula TaxID=447962 RepID=A0AAD5TYD5_9FUNG|nr:hypothetical protein HK099_007672 [Clydaea vesicula]KAJ3392982.1 hypothetical protein HDU92_008061 [Lobulomyces angularis]
MGQNCCKEEEINFDGEVELMHFNLLRSVGKGAFGKVRVVQHRKSNSIYALKYINKAQCIKMKAVENIIQERRLLEEISCAFVCNLRYAFQDEENMFMVIDLMLGGDLRFHLDRQGQMKEEQVCFYMAELSYGLSILHSRKIVHRDLKPDNVLLDDAGHAHLTDFNIAVHFREDKPLTAVAGSMAYMAPEILAKKGYLSTIDWWSLGVMMYELIFGNRPFRAKTNEALTNAILGDDVYIPSQATSICSQECIDCINAYLTRDITKRLGVKEMGGYEGIKAHPFFKKINWVELEAKKATPPFVPDAKRANFDATHELEELLLEDNPLKNKPKKKKNGELVPTKLSDDPVIAKAMQTMYEKFTVYDYTKNDMNLGIAVDLKDEKSLAAPQMRKVKPGVPGEESMLSIHKDVMEGRDEEVNNVGLESHLSNVKSAAE